MTFISHIKTNRYLYSFWDKLIERGSDIHTLREIETTQGEHYKLIQLTEKGIAQGKQQLIERACQNLNAYNDSSCVPAVIKANSEQLMVQWIEGTPLDQLTLQAADYADLGRFVASNLQNIENINVEHLPEHVNRHLNTLIEQGVLATNLRASVNELLDGKILPPKNANVAICFGDVEPKNFVRDKAGRLHYIDVFGIYRALLGQIFIKQLVRIPVQFREEFVSSYQKHQQILFESDIELNLPFYLLNYLVTVIYIYSQKPGFFLRLRGRRKARLALQNLEKFIRAAEAGENLRQWIMESSIPTSLRWYKALGVGWWLGGKM